MNLVFGMVAFWLCVVDSHREEMRTKARNIENLKLGKPNRYFKGGDHGQRLRDFWQNRRNKQKGN